MSETDGVTPLLDATVVLTGATSGIGYATALALAPLTGRLILQGREPQQQVEQRISAIRAQKRPTARLEYYAADFSRLAEVSDLAQAIHDSTNKIDVLINNAGRPGPPRRLVTGDGWEATLQTNYLAPVLLASHLAERVGQAPPGRIVNIASATHLSASLELEDLNLARTSYSSSGAYARSKLALVVYSLWLAAHRPKDLDVVSMHPGVIATPLLHAMFSIGGEPPERAASAILSVAGRQGDNGTYYDERAPAAPSPIASDPSVQDRLHRLTLEMLGDFLPRETAGRF